ncbi:MAG: YihY/virulence factor BrkB family protein [Candidatus Limnocylindria bacterium]
MTAIADWLKARLQRLADRSSLIAIGWEAIQSFNAHEATARAAAIAYYSILSLFPFAMLAVVVASLLIGHGPEFDALVERIAVGLGFEPDSVAWAIEGLLNARGTLAVLGLALLVLAVAPWMSAVQRGIVQAFGEERRSHLRTTVGSLLLLGMAALLILLSGVWASMLGFIIGLVDRWLGDVAILDVTLRLVLSLLPGAVVFGAMLVLLRVIPGQRPTVGDVWLGAVITGLAFLALRYGFDLYVQLFVVDSGNAAGPFGGVLIGLLFVDFLAVAILAGAELAGVVFRRRRARDQAAEGAAEGAAE